MNLNEFSNKNVIMNFGSQVVQVMIIWKPRGTSDDYLEAKEYR